MTKDEALKLSMEAMEITGGFDVEITAIKEALAQPEPMRLRRGDILRCIETDELCTVWSTSTTGKTLIKWGANDFGGYTAEQIGELFWLEPSPDDLELAAEKSDNYAAFHAGYRFAVAHPLAQPEPWEKFCDSNCVWTDHHPDCKLAQPDQYAKGYADAMNWKVQNHLEHLPAAQPEQDPVAFPRQAGKNTWTVDTAFIWRVKHTIDPDTPNDFTPSEKQIETVLLALEKIPSKLYTAPPQRKPLSDEEIILIVAECASSHQHTDIHFARAIEAAVWEKQK